jgi:hypothetical protein
MGTTSSDAHLVTATTAILFLLGTAPGCSEQDGATWGSSYSVDYKVVSPGGDWAGIEATIKGPAAKLAVVLTDPEGKSEHAIVQKDEMMSNSHSVRLGMREPHAGTYVLAVKTVDPEAVVWRKELAFSAAQLSVKDVAFGFEPNTGKFELRNVQIALKKDGDLPVQVRDVSFTMDGKTFGGFVQGGMIVGDDEKLVVTVNMVPPTKKQVEQNDIARRGGEFAPLPPISALFDPGERYSVEVKLFYGKDRTCLTFNKELVAPAAPAGGRGASGQE